VKELPMKLRKALKTTAVLLATVGLLVPQVNVAIAAGPQGTAVNPGPSIIDVALEPGGTLQGQLVDGQGLGRAGAPVSVQQQGREVARAVTDDNGYFKISGLRGGIYVLATADGEQVARLWTGQTAPPAAETGVLMVTGDQTTRGQFGAGWASWGVWVGLGVAVVASPILAGLALNEVNRLHNKVDLIPTS
jgi:hypothetical protein